MRRFFSFRRLAVALAVLGFAGTGPAARAGSFVVEGTYDFTDNKGRDTSGTLSGTTKPGGDFSGSFAQTAFRGAAHFLGTAPFDYGGGDSFTFPYDVVFDDGLNLYVGSYTVTGGTGSLARASGSGAIVIEPGNTTGGFTLEGSLKH